MGELTGEAENSSTIHAGIEQFKGERYLIYHDGMLTIDGVPGSQYRRLVAAARLTYDESRLIRPITRTRRGASRRRCRWRQAL